MVKLYRAELVSPSNDADEDENMTCRSDLIASPHRSALRVNIIAAHRARADEAVVDASCSTCYQALRLLHMYSWIIFGYVLGQNAL